MVGKNSVSLTKEKKESLVKEKKSKVDANILVRQFSCDVTKIRKAKIVRYKYHRNSGPFR